MPARKDGGHFSSWTGGRDVHPRDGYVRLLNHHGRGRHAREHVVIVERVIGHRLPAGAIVHHVNMTRDDNRNANLAVLQSHADHRELHRKLTVLRAGGNPWADRLCCMCHRTKPASEFYAANYKRDGTTHSSRCLDCARTEARERQRQMRADGYRQDPVMKREWRAKNREKVRTYGREYARANRRRIAELIAPWKKRNAHKLRAQRVVQSELRAGRIERPMVCQRCRQVASVEAHHEDYAEPLAIDWLCKPCHWTADEERREREAEAA